jgi:two-component system response regulator FixJ
MVAINRIHIVDSDVSRRAKFAHQLYSRSYHAEIYDSVDELVICRPTQGAILIGVHDRDTDEKVSLETIRLRTNFLPVAFFSERPSPDRIVRAMLSGAIDYLEWPMGSDALEAALQRLGSEGARQAKLQRRKADALSRVAALTPREMDVLERLVGGSSNKLIAQDLGISPRTVEIHRGNMMSRLNAESISDAIRIGVYAGLGEDL